MPKGGPEKLSAHCRGIPRPDEIGCWVSIILEVFRITPYRVSWLKRMLGLQKPCGCHKREEQLNSWGARLWSAIKSRPQTNPEPASKTSVPVTD